MKTTPATFDAGLEIVRPPERLRISDWAEKFAVVPHTDNEEPGKFHLSRMPHQTAMLDDPMEPGVRETFWMMASQLAGKTFSLSIIQLYASKVLRRSTIMVMPTEKAAKKWMRKKFLPIARATIPGFYRDPRQRDSESSVLNRAFDGGNLQAIGAGSPGEFSGTSAANINQDEIDRYEDTKEGSAVDLADRAAKTFSDAWKIKCSTPTRKGFSRIDAGYESGDKQKYFIPCPCCGQFQDLKFSQLKFSFTAEESARIGPASNFTWEIGEHPVRNTLRAMYVCEHCHHGWTDSQRIAAYLSGHKDNPAVMVNGKELRAEWRSTAPFAGIRSRHLNGMYGTIGLKKGFASYLHQFAEEFLAAKRGGRETLMVWTNLFLAEAFEDAAEQTDWRDLANRAEDYVAWHELPAQVVWLNWGMDVHPDRVEILFYGWGARRECWALQKHVEYGDFDLQSMQDTVWSFLDGKKFPHPVLGELKWSIGLIDSGYQTKVQAVYQFCGKHRWRNVFSSKGFDTLASETVVVKKERRFGGSKVNLNTDYFKSTIFDRLKNTEPGESYIHFPKLEVVVTQPDGQRMTIRTGFSNAFYQGLCSEKKVMVKQRLGGYKSEWHKLTSATRNENLDCTVGCFAGWEVSQIERSGAIERKWKEVERKLEAMHLPTEKEKPDVITPPAAIVKPEARKTVVVKRKWRIASPFARRF